MLKRLGDVLLVTCYKRSGEKAVGRGGGEKEGESRNKLRVWEGRGKEGPPVIATPPFWQSCTCR